MGYYLEYNIYDIKNLEKDEQIKIMKNWFLSNYQDPQNECPYDKEEGDYVYIYGGPYYAKEELIDEFDEYVDEELIDELVNELDNVCYEWSGMDFDRVIEYEDIEKMDINPFLNLKESIITLEKLLDIDCGKNLSDTFNNMITANCITVLEAFLSEYLLHKVLCDNNLLRNAIEKINHFKDVKISLNEIVSKYEDLRNIVKDYLSNLSYHNLAKISNIYEQIFDVKFPKEIGGIYKMIKYRHDIVHRNGKNKDGSKIFIEKNDIKKLLNDIGSLAEFINTEMSSYKF